MAPKYNEMAFTWDGTHRRGKKRGGRSFGEIRVNTPFTGKGPAK